MSKPKSSLAFVRLSKSAELDVAISSVQEFHVEIHDVTGEPRLRHPQTVQLDFLECCPDLQNPLTVPFPFSVANWAL